MERTNMRAPAGQHCSGLRGAGVSEQTGWILLARGWADGTHLLLHCIAGGQGRQLLCSASQLLFAELRSTGETVERMSHPRCSTCSGQPMLGVCAFRPSRW